MESLFSCSISASRSRPCCFPPSLCLHLPSQQWPFLLHSTHPWILTLLLSLRKLAEGRIWGCLGLGPCHLVPQARPVEASGSVVHGQTRVVTGSGSTSVSNWQTARSL